LPLTAYGLRLSARSCSLQRWASYSFAGGVTLCWLDSVCLSLSSFDSASSTPSFLANQPTDCTHLRDSSQPGQLLLLAGVLYPILALGGMLLLAVGTIFVGILFDVLKVVAITYSVVRCGSYVERLFCMPCESQSPRTFWGGGHPGVCCDVWVASLRRLRKLGPPPLWRSIRHCSAPGGTSPLLVTGCIVSLICALM
jgi:hypothetical protein